MRIVIDVTDTRFGLVLNPSNRHNYVEGDATVSRTYSALTLGQLQRLYLNTTGVALTTSDYNAALQSCKYLALRLLSANDTKGGFPNGYDLEKEDGEAIACESSIKNSD